MRLLVLLCCVLMGLVPPDLVAVAQTIPVDLQPYGLSLRPGFERDLLANANAPHYDIDMTIDPARRIVTGTQRIRYVNREDAPMNDIVLRLYPNTAYMGGGMVLSDVVVDGRPAAVEPYLPEQLMDGSAVRVVLATPLRPKQVMELKASFAITAPINPKNGYTTFGQIEGVLALPNAYAMIAARASGFWQVTPAPLFGDIVRSDVALYRVSIHAPANFVVVPSGVCEPKNPSNESVQTLTCVAAPARDFAVHGSQNYRVLTSVAPDNRGNNVVVRSYFTPLREQAGANALLYAGEALRAFERRFGPYPYRELNVFESQSIAGGIEYPMAVGVTYSKYVQDGGYLEWITAHEVAHQWWYGLVGSDPIREAWLDEALAQYSASLYIEDRYGKTLADAERQRFFSDRYAAEVQERGDERAGQPNDAFYRWTYAPIVYGKAPLFFAEARQNIGDARFDQWLRRYFEQFRFRTAHGEDLLRTADGLGFGRAVREAHARFILGR